MGEVEKPFGCPELNCGMRFTNEDHLQVHRRFHDMQLTVGYGLPTPSLVKHSGFIIDQTPTPTRFMKQNEDVNLFQDFNLNPFDVEFRRASQSRSQLSVPEVHGNNESLETPRIVPLVESDETISSTSRDDIMLGSNVAIHPSFGYGSTGVGVSSSHSDSRNGMANETDRKECRRQLTLNVSSSPEATPSSNVISTPTPVITAGPSVSQSLGVSGCSTPSLDTPTILHTGTNNIPTISLNNCPDIDLQSLSPTLHLSSPPALVQTMQVQQTPCGVPQLPQRSGSTLAQVISTSSASMPSVSTISSSSLSVPPSPATVLQLVLRFPNGQAFPVEIPANPVVSSVAPSLSNTKSVINIAPTPTPTSASATNLPIGTVINSPSSLAKMKLKEALASSNTAARPGNSKLSRANTAHRIAEMTRKRSFSGVDIQEDSSSSSSSCCSSGTSNPSVTNETTVEGKRRRHSSLENDPIDKRKKFLERNRVAAIKCREKKKLFVETLSAKSDELGSFNRRLQSELAYLKSEVAMLKSLLLLHKDCPVTIAMRDGIDLDGSPCANYNVERPSGVITGTCSSSSRKVILQKSRPTTDRPISLPMALDSVKNKIFNKRLLQKSVDSAVQNVTKENSQNFMKESYPNMARESSPITTNESYQNVAKESFHNIASESFHRPTKKSSQNITNDNSQNITKESYQNNTEESSQNNTKESSQNITRGSNENVTKESFHNIASESYNLPIETSQNNVKESSQNNTRESSQNITKESSQNNTNESSQNNTKESSQNITKESSPTYRAQNVATNSDVKKVNHKMRFRSVSLPSLSMANENVCPALCNEECRHN